MKTIRKSKAGKLSMKSKGVISRKAGIFSSLLILFLAASMCLSSVNANGVFPLAAASSSEAVPTSTAAPSEMTGLFSLLATATPTPSPVPTPEPTAVPTADPANTISASERFLGLSYTDLTGKGTDRVYENRENGTWEYVYEQVTKEDYQQYGVYLGRQGCTAESVKTDLTSAAASRIYSQEKSFGFRAVYQTKAQVLTLIFGDQEEPEASPQPGETVSTPTAAPAPDESSYVPQEERVCSHCDYGFCRSCQGIGYFQCDYCYGNGVCPTCLGKRQFRIPGFGGVGTASYVTCSGCGGTGKCSRCGGKPKQDCSECDGGICRYCHGDYFLDP